MSRFAIMKREGRLLFVALAALLLLSLIPLSQAYGAGRTIDDIHNGDIITAGETIERGSSAYKLGLVIYHKADATFIEEDTAPGDPYTVKPAGGFSSWSAEKWFTGVDWTLRFTATSTAKLNTTGLVDASAALQNASNQLVYDSVVTVEIRPNSGKGFESAPSVTADKATVGTPMLGPDGLTYYCDVTNFIGDTVITVAGVAKDAYTAALDTTGLKGAAAFLSQEIGILSTSRITVSIVPDSNKAFASIPTVTAAGATAGSVTKQADGSYLCTVSGFTSNATITVVGEAKGGDPKPLPTPSDNGKNLAKTGDTTNIALLGSVIGISACIAAFGAVAHRRRKHAEK